eukprot:16267-Heterococcus_DN1.PRE.1
MLAAKERVRPGRLLVVLATSCKLHAGYEVCKIAVQLGSSVLLLVRSFTAVHRKLLQLVSQACIASSCPHHFMIEEVRCISSAQHSEQAVNRIMSLCILALVAVASTSAKSLRGSSAVAAAEQKPGALSKLIRRAQDNDDDDSKKCACKPNLDVAVLQFALNLEYLEAEFYSWVAYGKGLPECAGNSTGGQKANLTAPFQGALSSSSD